MKINILTQPLYINYGGILQNHALQEVLRRMGHEVLTLNVPVNSPFRGPLWKDIIKTGINFSKRLNGIYPYPFLSPYKNAKNSHEFSSQLGEFASKHINYVNVKAPFTTQIAEKYPADAWIVGSDQVWRPWCSHHIENCFFDFLSGDNNAKRIAYAASFGTDQWEMSDEQTKVVKPLAQKFDAVSVREESGVVLAEKYLGVKATHVLDPTMLLTAEDYKKLIPENLLARKTPKLTTYILDPTKEKVKEIRKAEKSLGLKEKRTGLMHKDRFDTIEEWLADFATADAVITDSFHGTVFSIILGKPFKVLKNPIRGNARLDSLLKLISLNKDKNGFYVWDQQSNETLSNLRKASREFLKLKL